MSQQATSANSLPGETAVTTWLIAGALLWLAIVMLASGTGLLAQLSPYAIAPIAFSLMALPALLFWRVSRVRAVIERVGLRRLTALHIFRILAAPMLFWYGAQGLLPRLFIDHAGWGDLISGVLALGVVTVWPLPGGYWIMHLVGMLDFIVAFATAMTLTRANPAAMAAVATLPVALIPFFFVGLLGSTHFMAYSILWRGRPTATSAP